MPTLHRSCVPALPSTGLSVSSLTVCTWPVPSHWTFLQSPGVWFGSAVPTAALFTPHWPFVHVWVWQVVSVPQLAAVMQPTQAPVPLHIKLVPQAVPADRLGLEATPAVQMSSVQARPSTGLS